MTRTIAALSLLLMSMGALSGFSNTSAGDAAHFLRDGLGARGRAVGSAQIALADGFAAAYWNPAPTIQSPSTVIGSGFEQRNNGLFTFGVLGGWHATETWTVGAVVLTSDLYRMYHAAGGVRVGHGAIGLGVRSYRFGIPGDTGSGLGFDAGARYVLDLGGPTATLAIVSRDIGWTPIRWGVGPATVVDRVAWVNRLGLALTVPFLTGEWMIELDWEFAAQRPRAEDDVEYWKRVGEVNVSCGLALRWSGISIRAGVQRFDVSSPGERFRSTIGLGVAVGDVTIDLALVPSSLGNTYLGGFQVDL